MGSDGFHAAVQAWLAGSPVLAALTLSVLAGIVLTGIGTLSVLAFGQLSEKRSAALLSFAAGVMLAASIFSLLLPGLELAETTSGSKPAAGLAVGLAVGAVMGAGAISAASGILPWGLGFSAGAMLYVISEEIIPETHRVGREGMATAMLFTGFLGMMYLDFTLG